MSKFFVPITGIMAGGTAFSFSAGMSAIGSSIATSVASLTLKDLAGGLLLAAAGGSSQAEVDAANAQRVSLDFQRRQALQQAERTQEIAGLEAARLAKDNKAISDRAFALLNARGDPSTGTALLLQGDIQEASDFDERLVLAGGDARAAAFRGDAALRAIESDAALRIGRTRAGATLLAGAGKAAAVAFG
jgi:hypothetical protein